MATVEFEPPRGLRPWQGAVLLDEAITTRSVSAWFADQIALDVLALEGPGGLRLARGPKWKDTDVATEQKVRDMIPTDESISLGRYQPAVSRVWDRVKAEQVAFVRSAKWWTRGGPETNSADGPAASLAASAWYVLGVPMSIVAVIVFAATGWMQSWWVVAAVAVVVVASVAGLAYSSMRAGRTAEGSALALRTESFRRFLISSEGQHVDWAWERGVLREYTAWAVALGAAAAWGRAIDASTVAPDEKMTLVAPSDFERQLGRIDSARNPPPPPSTGSSSSGSSSSFSSSSFSSGSVGGGGGGGSSGSW